MKYFTELSEPTTISSIKVDSGSEHCPKAREGQTHEHGWCCNGLNGEEQFD